MINKLSLALAVLSLVKAETSPTVTLASINSVVKGSTLTSYDGRPFNAFRGIPFAKSTSGSLRFKPPQPMEPWEGVLDATESGNSCPQFDKMRGIIGSEDCLQLNVYVPKTSKEDSKLLPVIVFIHGGAYIIGAGNYDTYGPEKWMDFDVVFVTMNYRLGIFGFLNSGDDQAYGNFGLLDQVLALHWVQDNIKGFGGDPLKVTLVGQSAGSGSVILHLLSPLSSGLFHKAVAQSAAPYMCKAFYQPYPLNWAKKIAKKVDCPTTDTAQMVDCFRRKSVNELIDGSHKLMVSQTLPLYCAPSKETQGGPGFLNENPTTLIREGKFVNKVPTLIGGTSHEFYTFLYEFLGVCKGHGRQFFDQSLPKCLHYFMDNITSGMDNVFSAIRKEYYKDLNVDDPKIFETVATNLLSDLTLASGISKSADYISKTGVPTYVYKYTHIGHHSLAGIFGGKNGLFATHVDDLFLQFNFLFSKFGKMTDDDYKISKLMNSLWVAFASDEPLKVTSPNSGNQFLWEKYDRKRPKYLEISLNAEMKEGKFCERDDFWTEKIPKLIAESKSKKDEL